MEIEHYLTREIYPWHCYRPPPERGSVGSSALEVDSACPHVLSARQEAGSSRSDPADSGWPIRLADRAWRFFPSYWGCPNPWRSRERERGVQTSITAWCRVLSTQTGVEWSMLCCQIEPFSFPVQEFFTDMGMGKMSGVRSAFTVRIFFVMSSRERLSWLWC